MAPVSVGTVLSVVGLAALGVLPIMIAALGGVVAMIVTGVIKPAEAYESVQWDVIFLFAGVIPLGKALSATGGADLLGVLVVSTADFLPVVAVLGLLYLPTAAMTNLFVYGPGGYDFRDYARVGAPLQSLLTVVTTSASSRSGAYERLARRRLARRYLFPDSWNRAADSYR